VKKKVIAFAEASELGSPAFPQTSLIVCGIVDDVTPSVVATSSLKTSPMVWMTAHGPETGRLLQQRKPGKVLECFSKWQ
jgi:hypothetical protein